MSMADDGAFNSDEYLSRKGIPYTSEGNKGKSKLDHVQSTELLRELLVRAATALVMSMQSEWSDFGKKNGRK